MNVYLYGGPSRYQATQSVTENNIPIELDQTYTIDYRIGFLVVAYPNKDRVTNFEFKYQLIASAAENENV